MQLVAWYIVAFCRVVTGLVFAFSGLSKARDLSRFRKAILGFELLPHYMSGLAALLFLGGEFGVVLLLAIGGSFLFAGFVLAALLLLIFCSALASALVRKLHISCNCFGASQKPVTVMDIWRNVGFLLCATGGCALLSWIQGRRESLGGLEWLLIGLGAGAFVLVWTQLEDIAQLFRQR